MPRQNKKQKIQEFNTINKREREREWVRTPEEFDAKQKPAYQFGSLVHINLFPLKQFPDLTRVKVKKFLNML